MADTFHFSNPRTCASVKHRCSLNNRSRPLRQLRPANMDKVTQRACVAQIHEPTVCPNDMALLLAQHPDLIQPVTIPKNDYNTSGSTLTNEVPDSKLRQYRHDHEVRIDPSSHTDGESSSTSNGSLPPRHKPMTPLSSISRRLYHVRPESRDVFEGDDGRRVRFALPSLDEDDAIRARLLRANEPEKSSFSVADDIELRQVREPDTARLEQTNTITEQNSGLTQVQTPTHLNHTSEALAPNGIHVSRLSDSATTHYIPLTVDHHARFYDFATFIDTWRGRSNTPTDLPVFVPGHQRPSGLVPHEVDREKVGDEFMDVQGLRWQNIGPCRTDALKARRLLRPLRASPASFQPLAEHSNSDIDLESESHYSYRAFTPKHLASISHYQLRHVLCASNRNDVYYASGNKVMHTSIAFPSAHSTIMDLSGASRGTKGFRITCLSASTSTYSGYRSDNIAIAGGFCGEYALLNLNSKSDSKPAEGFVTHAYDGIVTHVQITHHRQSGVPRAAFCSNDRKVRLMDVNSRCFTDTFTYEYPVNSSAMSPDGRCRVLVGDSHETLITDAEQGNIHTRLREHTEDAFACAWSPDSWNVATAAEDNRVLVWDARNWNTPLQTLRTGATCARSAQFTDDGALVVAEEDDVVSIYDTKTFESRQDIRFFGAIAGIALTDGGADLMIANADRTVGGLFHYERSSPGLLSGMLV